MFLRHLTHNALGVVSATPAAIFAGGDASTTYIDKYAYATDSVTNPTVLTQARYALTGTGNSTVGIFARGYNTSLSDKYTYAGDTCVSASALASYENRVGFSSSTIGFFSGGQTDSGIYQDFTDKYTYASNAVSNGTILGYATAYEVATGNPTYGLIVGGFGASNAVYAATKKYAFSDETVSSGTNLGIAKFGGAAVTDGTIAIITGGVDNTFTLNSYSDKYTYAGDVVTAATALIDAMCYYAGASNKTVGIFGGGETIINNSGTSINRTEKYTFSGDTVTPGTALGMARNLLGAVSSSPGYL
jgi:hypothetical protein